MRNAVAAVTVLLLGAPTPSETAVVFSAYRDGHWSVYATRATGEPQRVSATTGDALAPALSSDGRVAFERGGAVEVCTLRDPTSPCEIVHATEGTLARPAWISTTEIAVVRFQATATGEHSELLTRQSPDAQDPLQPLLSQTQVVDHPTAFPGTTRFLYTASTIAEPAGSAAHVVQQLWVFDRSQGVAHPFLSTVAQDTHAEVAPEGREIVFASNRSGQFELWLVRVHGTHLRQLSRGSGPKTWPAFSPDGRHIMFNWVRDGQQQIWMTPRHTWRPEPFRPFGPTDTTPLRDGDW